MNNPCDTCPHPGTCCQNFFLTLHHDTGTESWLKGQGGTYKAVQELMDHWGWPFVPVSGNLEEGYRFDCKWLVNGRCANYDKRPQLCRDFAPGSNNLCCLHKVD